MGPGDAIMGPGSRMLFSFFRTFVAHNLRLIGKDLAAIEAETLLQCLLLLAQGFPGEESGQPCHR